MKKTQTSTSILNSKSLPVIRIISTEDEVFTKLDLEMEDSTHDMLVKWGKEVATDGDYIGIGSNSVKTTVSIVVNVALSYR